MATIEEKKHQRSYLYRGDITKIAELAGVSRQSVYYWFRGKSNSIRIETAVYLLANKQRKEITKRLKKFCVL